MALCNVVSVVDLTRGNGDTREAILDATDRLLTTRGFRSVTMDDIAAEAGVSRRTVYMYFPSKEEVGLSSIDRVVAQTYARLVELASSGADPAEVLHGVLVERVLRRFDSVSAYRTSLDELFEAVRPAYMARRTAHMQREVALVAQVLAAGRACGRFELDDAAATASTLIKATNAFLPYSLSVAELGERARIAVEVRRMADLLLRSVVAPMAAVGRRVAKRGGAQAAAAPHEERPQAAKRRAAQAAAAPHEERPRTRRSVERKTADETPRKPAQRAVLRAAEPQPRPVSQKNRARTRRAG